MIYDRSSKTTRLSLSILIPIILSIFLTSCGMFDPVKVPETKTYQISTSNALKAPLESPPKKGVIRVEKMQSASPYSSTNMYYTMKNNEIKPYAYSRWVAPPNSMLSNILLEQIDSANLYQATVSPLFLGQVNYRLSTVLLEFNQHMENRQSYTSMKVLAQLANNQTGVVIKQHLFNIQVNSESTPHGMVDAMNKSTNVLVEQVIAWLNNQPIPKAQIPIKATVESEVPVAATKHTPDNKKPAIEPIEQQNSTLPNSQANFYQL
ncbi:ABC-type transport auxiliary lipoprotein family protein [Thiotrichales bacterium 19S3-7]|nr:ABC-type transport auxiliary lipoprotein family protein [Thiotrichales bacterium 19S3-7]MCF6802016.1 ABC-type transport auxiliary lipoprotein family protein [Thiotrichales bacterium 19S3-11]